MITGALDASMTIDNRLLFGFVKTEVKDKDGNTVYTTDENGNKVPLTTNGFQSIASDFSNFGSNLAKAVAGAASTISSPFTAVYDSLTADSNNASKGENSQNDSKNIIDVWKANQSGNATGILRGGSQDFSDIVDKVKTGTATPEEIQTLASYTSTGKGNLIYSDSGEVIDKSTGKVVLGFNDIKNNQGYVDASKTSTNALDFYLTDAEERAHNYTSNEDIAKGAAKSELNYYNFVSALSGNTTIAGNTSSTGGYGTQLQTNWNNTYNTSTSNLLNQNTEKANLVADKDKAFAVYVNSQNKVVKVTDDGDYNAYRVSDDVAREDIEKAQEDGENNKYKDKRLWYYSFMASEENKNNGTLIEDVINAENSFNNKNVHGDLLYLDSFDNTKSLSDNAYLSDNTKAETFVKLFKIADSGVNIDDYSLSNVLAPSLYNALGKTNQTGGAGNNPTNIMSNLFDFKINNVSTALPIVAGEARGSTGCNTSNCGDIGAKRKNGARPHFGTDILGDEGDWVIAGRDGTVRGTTTKADKGTMDGINLQTNSGWIQMLYATSNVKEKTKVKQGDIIGTVNDLSKGYDDVVNHSHIELFEGYKKQEYIKKNGSVGTDPKKYNYQDSNQILAPNRGNPFGIDQILEYQKQQQKKIEQIKQQQNSK